MCRAPFAVCAAVVVAAGFGRILSAQLDSPVRRVAPTTGPGVERAVGFYDERRRRVVLVGATAQAKADQRDAVWSWSGTRWEVVTSSGPPSRANAAGAYDRRHGRAVVAGGASQSASDGGWQVIGDSWVSEDESWTQFGVVPPRDHHAMVTDGRGAVLVYGGIPANRSEPWPTDTWELGREGWTRVATEGPAGRGRTAVAYDSTRGQVVLFGGVSAPSSSNQQQTFFNDTWVWQQAHWRKVADGGPRGRYAHAMVFDERARVVLMYGGSAAHSNAPLTDMWQWDGNRWTEIPLTGATPGYRYQPVMVYDRARGRTVLYGGLQGSRDDTWEWDGHRWQEIRP